MYYTSIDYLDRLRAKNVFQGTYATLLGALGSLILIAATLALDLPTIVSFFRGQIYSQSQFSLQQTPFGNITIPKDMRVAMVFYNKTDNQIANHTLLRQYLTVTTYQITNSRATIKSDSILPGCDPAYFQNTYNPPQNFTDCIIFAKNSKVDITYYASRGYVYFGFYSFPLCQDPFACLTNSTFKNTLATNFTNVFSNFSYTLYFTSRVLQPDATFKDQVFSIFSSSFNTPFTITSDIYGEIQMRNTTMDDSLLPWFNYKQKTYPAWYGSMQSSPRNTSNLNSTGVRNGFIASRFQNQVFRHYKKIDWLLGIIGGTMFLFFIVLYLPLYYINQGLKQGKLIEEFFVRHTLDVTDENTISDQKKLVFFGGNVHLLRVEQSRLYILKKLLPCYESRQERQLKMAFDIVRLIKNIKVAERNLKNQKIPLNQQPKQLKIVFRNQEEQQQREHAQLLPDTSQIGPQLGDASHIEQNFINNETAQPVFPANQVPVQTQIQREQDQDGIVGAEQRPKQEQQFTEQRLAQRAEWDSQTIDRYSKVIGMHPEVMSAAIKSDNVSEMAIVNPTLMVLTKKQEAYESAVQPYRYSQSAKRRESCFSKLSNHFFRFLRFFDIFGVQPQFGLHSSGSSIFGCLCTLFIAGCSILFFIFIILNSMNYQTYIQYDFQESEKVTYNLVTGVGFRPFLCLSYYSSYIAINSTSPTIQLTFFSVSGNKTTTIPMINLDSSMHSYLGIAEDSSYRSINLNYCWAMQDNFTIPMGGYNTSNQAYFGFRFDPYCSGTVAYCQSINSTLKTRFVSFMGFTSNTFTLYLPFSTYDPQSKTLSGGGIQPQIIRQGTSAVSINSGTVQNFYVNSIQLIDDYTMRFMDSEKPPVIQQTITTDRYQLNSDINGVIATVPFYQVRVRPNSQLTKVVLTGIPTKVVLGVIGGICVIFYAFFHCFAKSVNHYNLRCSLAYRLYGEQIIQQSFFYKLLVLLLPERLCRCLGKQLSQSLLMDKEIDRVIKYQLNHSQMIKQNYAVYQLSTAGFTKTVQKFLGLVYFKEPVSEDYLYQAPQQPVKKDVHGDQFVGVQDHEHQSVHSESQGQMNKHENGVANLQQGEVQNQPVQNIQNAQRPLSEQTINYKHNLEEVQPYNPYRLAPQNNKILETIDWFSSKPSFTLDGERKAKSVFGSCIFFGMVACIIVLVSSELQAYVNGSNSRISYQKYMISDISKEPGLVLNSSNFRLALGFYLNPNTSFINVSSLVNTTSNIIITVSQINMLRDSNNVLTQNETINRLVPCSNDYFDSFKDRNTDYSFLNRLPLAWCLPLNISLNLTAISSKNPMQYFTMRIINKTNDTTTATNLRTLTSTYAVALYMTVPQIDLASKSFKYMVKPIRGIPRPISFSTQYNVTLYKQQIVYTTPNYTLNPPQTKVSSYIYLNNKNNERNYPTTNSSLARSHNITFSYMGLVEKFVYQQPNPNEIVGIIGGLIALFFVVSHVIAESFNMYKFKYRVAKQLYLIRRAQTPLQTREKKKDQVNDEKLQLIEREKDMDYQVEVNELELLGCWMLSFFCYCRCFKKFIIVSTLQKKAEQVLNLSDFLEKTAKLKDTLNKKYFLQADQKIKVTNLTTKLPLLEEESQFQLQQVRKEYIQKHGLSSFDQYILSLVQNQQECFENVYGDRSIYDKIYQNLEGQPQNFVQMRQEKQKSSQQIQIAEPDLRPQTTKFEEMPQESFYNLQALKGDGVQREEKEEVLQSQSLQMPKKDTFQDGFVMIGDEDEQKEQIKLKVESEEKQKNSELPIQSVLIQPSEK